MPLTNPIREPLIEELESLIPELAPTKHSRLPGIQTSKTLLYQTSGESEDLEKLNLIETAIESKTEFSRRIEADDFIINKASDINKISSATTRDAKTKSSLRDAKNSEVDPLIGKPDSDLGDPLTNPNSTASNSEPFDSNKPVPHPPAISSSVSNSELNKTTPATTTASERLPENKTQLPLTAVANSEKENNKTLPVVTTSTNLEKASDKTSLPATAETSLKPQDNKIPLSSGATLKSDSEPNKTSPATVSTVDRSEPNKTSPETAPTIIPDRSTTSSEKSEKIAVTNLTETIQKAPIAQTSETKNSDKQLPVAEAVAKIDSDKKSPTVDAIATEKPTSNSQLPTTQPPTAPLIPAISNPVSPDTSAQKSNQPIQKTQYKPLLNL